MFDEKKKFYKKIHCIEVLEKKKKTHPFIKFGRSERKYKTAFIRSTIKPMLSAYLKRESSDLHYWCWWIMHYWHWRPTYPFLKKPQNLWLCLARHWGPGQLRELFDILRKEDKTCGSICESDPNKYEMKSSNEREKLGSNFDGNLI